jgi:uncharacterized protein YqcC (DUF446 family)
MPRSHKEVEILITKLEHSLRDAMLWSTSAPTAKALQSIVPFAYDTMQFEQWLQFIFIPKMFDIVSKKSALPNNLNLLPMGEQCFSTAYNRTRIIEVIRQIDLVFAVS